MVAACLSANYVLEVDGVVENGEVDAERVVPGSALKLSGVFNCACGASLVHRVQSHPQGTVGRREAHFATKPHQPHNAGCEIGAKLIANEHKSIDAEGGGFRINVNFGLPGYSMNERLRDGERPARRQNFASDSAARVYKAAKHVENLQGDEGLGNVVVSYMDQNRPHAWEDFCINRTSYGRLPELIGAAGDRFRARPFMIVAQSMGELQRHDEKSRLFAMQPRRIEMGGLSVNIAPLVRSYNPEIWDILREQKPIAFMAVPTHGVGRLNEQFSMAQAYPDRFDCIEVEFVVNKENQIIRADNFKPLPVLDRA